MKPICKIYLVFLLSLSSAFFSIITSAEPPPQLLLVTGQAEREQALFGTAPSPKSTPETGKDPGRSTDTRPQSTAENQTPARQDIRQRETELFGSEPIKHDGLKDSESEPSLDNESKIADRPFSDLPQREAELFGTDERENNLFGAKPGSQDYAFDEAPFEDNALKPSLGESLGARLQDQDNPLEIGGRLFFSNLLLNGEDASIGESTYSNNAIVDLYFDAKLSNDIRFYYQQQVTHAIEGDDSVITLFLSQFSESSDVDQLWLKFSIQEKYFFTMGKQPTKLGSGFVWQPTDFLNTELFNPLDLTDQRLGVNLIKLQVPLPQHGLNLYSIAKLNEVETLQDVGVLLRAEYLAENGEYGISFNTQRKKATRVGFDFSRGIKAIDLSMAVAVIHNDPTPFFEGTFSLDDGLVRGIANAPDSIDRSDQYFRQYSTGILYSKSIFETKTILFNAEVFYNEAGYEESDLLTFSIINGLIPNSDSSFNPLYYNKRYGALGATIIGLGKDRDQTLTTILIANADDDTGVLQFVYSSQPFRDLSLSISAGWFYGNQGTFRPDVDFAEIELLQDLAIQPPKFSSQIEISLQF